MEQGCQSSGRAKRDKFENTGRWTTENRNISRFGDTLPENCPFRLALPFETSPKVYPAEWICPVQCMTDSFIETETWTSRRSPDWKPFSWLQLFLLLCCATWNVLCYLECAYQVCQLSTAKGFPFRQLNLKPTKN